jgi:serine phosphatase RsbU (regulator of sigma subunit)
VQAHLGMPAQQLCDQLVDTLTAYRGTSPQADDITLLAVRAAPDR